MPHVPCAVRYIFMAINLTFLKDGANGQALSVATELAEFISAAKSSLHIAIYDFRLKQEALSTPVIKALKDSANKGVHVRIAFYAGKPAKTKGDKGEAVMDMDLFLATGGDPAPTGTETFLNQNLKDSQVEIRGITGSKLMHNKYIVRDVHTQDAAVWTGSTNFTDDAWTYQENNILRIDSPELASFYETDFQELWVNGDIASTGVDDMGTVNIDSTEVEVAFAPGDGQTIDQIIAQEIGQAKHRIKVASMILSSHNILAALDEALRSEQVSEFGGIYDRTEMSQILKKWEKSSNSAGVAQTFKDVASHLVGKHSQPYKADGKHDFMHNKVVVCDDVVVTGSFNFSRSATQNAENILVLPSKELADQYSAYIDERTKHYAGAAK